MAAPWMKARKGEGVGHHSGSNVVLISARTSGANHAYVETSHASDSACKRERLAARGKSDNRVLQWHFQSMLDHCRAGWFPAPPLPLLLERLKCVRQSL